MTKHTPGPLALALSESLQLYRRLFGEEMHGTEAQIEALLELGPIKKFNANARLIAAAPELLNLATAVVANAHGDDKEFSKDYGCFRLTPEANDVLVNLARHAIAKTEGRS